MLPQGCTKCWRGDRGSRNKAVIYCEKCVDFLCSSCRESHSKGRLTKQHRVRYIFGQPVYTITQTDKYSIPRWHEVYSVCPISSTTFLVSIRDLGCFLKQYNNFKVSSTLFYSDNIHGMICLPEDQAAVAVGEKIQIVSARGRLSSVRDIKVSGKCQGLCYSDGKLMVTYPKTEKREMMYPDGILMFTYHYTRKLDIMDLDGTVYRTVTLYAQTTRSHLDILRSFFLNMGLDYTKNTYNVNKIAVSTTSTGKYVYVLDSDYTVTKFTMEGRIVFEERSDKYDSNCGLVAMGDSVIAMYTAHSIQVISDDDGEIDIVQEFNFEETLSAVHFLQEENSLYIVTNIGEIIVYKVTEVS